MTVWHPMNRPPAIAPGEEIRVLVAWRSKRRDHLSSGELYYLNQFVLNFWDGDAPDDAVPNGDDGVEYMVTGWHERLEGGDGDVIYRRIEEQYVEHLGWTHMPILVLGDRAQLSARPFVDDVCPSSREGTHHG